MLSSVAKLAVMLVMLSMTKHFPKDEKKFSKIHIQTSWFSETFTTILGKIFAKLSQNMSFSTKYCILNWLPRNKHGESV